VAVTTMLTASAMRTFMFASAFTMVGVPNRCRISSADVLAGEVAQGGLDAPEYQGTGVGVAAHRGAVHDLGYAAVDVGGGDVVELEDLEPLFGRECFQEPGGLVALRREVLERQLGDLLGEYKVT